MATGWDHESGDWRNLDSPNQAPRYEALAYLIDRLLRRNPSVLDVGCGEAVLADYLPPCDYNGLEPSELACSRAAARRNGILTATAEHYEPGHARWDAVLFNEVLYYCRDPIAVLAKYADSLAAGGILLISIFQKPARRSPRRWLARLVGRRKTIGNLRCTRLVEYYFAAAGWTILRALSVDVPDAPGATWRILAATKSDSDRPPEPAAAAPASRTRQIWRRLAGRRHRGPRPRSAEPGPTSGGARNE